jgi:transposase
LREEIVRTLTRLEFVQGQIKAVEQQRAGRLADADRGARYTRALMRFYGIGIEIASTLAREVYYRDFANRRQVGSYVGLSPSPYQSGDTNHEQGISKAGNRLARHKAIELAWLWLEHQPQSALSRWFYARLGPSQSKRFKRVLAVALARKLVVALWRYLTKGVVPEGARLKPC